MMLECNKDGNTASNWEREHEAGVGSGEAEQSLRVQAENGQKSGLEDKQWLTVQGECIKGWRVVSTMRLKDPERKVMAR